MDNVVAKEMYERFPDRVIFSATCNRNSSKSYEEEDYADVLVSNSLRMFAVKSSYQAMIVAEFVLDIVKDSIKIYYNNPLISK